MPVLTRCWQMLLKGLSEARMAPVPLAAGEMVLIRLAYTADLPPPGDLVQQLQERSPGKTPAPQSPPPSAQVPTAPTSKEMSVTAKQQQPRPKQRMESAPNVATVPKTVGNINSFKDVVALFEEKREGILTTHLYNDVHLVHFATGRIEFRPGEHAPRDLANRIGHLLSEWTRDRWVVSLSDAVGEPSLAEVEQLNTRQRFSEADRHPLVTAVKEVFPGAKVTKVTDLDPG